MQARGRRSGARKAAKKSALAALAAAKAGGRRRIQQVEVEDEEDVYDEVTEEQYRSMVAERRRGGDFVVDDEGDGAYNDDGEEHWDRSTRAARADAASRKRERGQGSIAKAFRKSAGAKPSGGGAAAAGPKAKRRKARKSEEAAAPAAEGAPAGGDDYMLDLLNQLDEDDDEDAEGAREEAAAPAPPARRRPAPRAAEPVTQPPEVDEDEDEDAEEDDAVLDEAAGAAAAAAAPKAKAKAEAADPDAPPPLEPAAGARPALGAARDAAPDNSSWFALQDSKKQGDAASVPAANADGWTAAGGAQAAASAAALDEADEISMYYFDAYEAPFSTSGNVFLVGKVLVPGDGPQRTESCCVTVRNMERNVFLLPREFLVEDPRRPEETETDRKVEIVDVYKEFEAVAKRHGIKKWMSRPSKKRYAFERKGAGVPDEATYLEVLYSSRHAALPRELSGRTFSAVFGAKASMLEQLLLQRRLMGPSWVRLKGARRVTGAAAVSWCRHEFEVEAPTAIEVMPGGEAPPVPRFTVTSLAVKTVLNPSTHQNEVAVVSALTHSSVSVEGATENPAGVTHWTLACPGRDRAWPFDLQETVSEQKLKLRLCADEKALLNLLVALVHREDPDVLVGHALHGFTLEVLLKRMQALGVKTWSKIGRLKRSRVPRTSAGGFNVAEQDACTGRLPLDVRVSGEELVRLKNYSLAHMAETQLREKVTEIDVNLVPQYFQKTKDVVWLAQHTENDAFVALKLMFKLVVLPLTRQLTSLAGNLWVRSLLGKRAERVEYLLLHEFHSLNFVVPEKYTGKERRERAEQKARADTSARRQKKKRAAREARAAAAEAGSGGGPAAGDDEDEDEDEDEDDGAAAVVGAKRGKRKPDYVGGLVLDPIVGFYDKFVVMLDYNSLYPSIIREFNICFTTVRHWGLEPDERARVPSTSSKPGILPAVMKRLLERRRTVKKLLKEERDPSRRTQLDIRQKALKLVANSMYGCLGFPSSRFYCKPLAALITLQGREILQRTKELAESLGFQVVYGDTDSIMIYTGTDDPDEARRVGNQLRKEVNKQYQVLEVAIDGMYKRMLLLRKKKYASLSVVERPGPNGTRVLQEEREYKGLDLVRRDWSELSKDVGNFVLELLLSGGDRDEVVERIHAHLKALGAGVAELPLAKFVITKGLTKEPSKYPNPRSMPHVLVAMQMMEAGKAVRVGSYIEYVVCEGDQPVAERARHPEAVAASNGELKVDYQWYLSNQVLPPTARLCAPIEETSAARMAECLGLDGRKYARFLAAEEEEDEAEAPVVSSATREDDEELFRDCERLALRCGHCARPVPEFAGVYDPARGLASGLECAATPGCPGLARGEADAYAIQNAIDVAVARHARAFYASPVGCPECGVVTRQVPSHGRCVTRGCRGTPKEQYGARRLYLQLVYYASLFDVDRAQKIAAAEVAAATAKGGGGAAAVGRAPPLLQHGAHAH